MQTLLCLDTNKASLGPPMVEERQALERGGDLLSDARRTQWDVGLVKHIQIGDFP